MIPPIAPPSGTWRRASPPRRTSPSSSPRTPRATRARSQILIQSKTASPNDPAYRAAVRDVEKGLAAQKDVTKLESPYAKGNEGQISDPDPVQDREPE